LQDQLFDRRFGGIDPFSYRSSTVIALSFPYFTAHPQLIIGLARYVVSCDTLSVKMFYAGGKSASKWCRIDCRCGMAGDCRFEGGWNLGT
jgi:hypothetical protein